MATRQPTTGRIQHLSKKLKSLMTSPCAFVFSGPLGTTIWGSVSLHSWSVAGRCSHRSSDSFRCLGLARFRQELSNRFSWRLRGRTFHSMSYTPTAQFIRQKVRPVMANRIAAASHSLGSRTVVGISDAPYLPHVAYSVAQSCARFSAFSQPATSFFLTPDFIAGAKRRSVCHCVAISF